VNRYPLIVIRKPAKGAEEVGIGYRVLNKDQNNMVKIKGSWAVVNRRHRGGGFFLQKLLPLLYSKRMNYDPLGIHHERSGMFTLKEIYDLGIQIERNGEKFYREALKQPWSAPMASMLRMLAEEEVRHVDFFAKRKEKLNQKGEDPELEAMGREMLKEVLGEQTFSLKEADLSKIKNIEQLRSTAIEFEKDTILFYEMVRSFVTDKETQDQLDGIIEEENRHVKLFEEFNPSDIPIHKEK
jgi:rubrerythrin